MVLHRYSLQKTPDSLSNGVLVFPLRDLSVAYKTLRLTRKIARLLCSRAVVPVLLRLPVKVGAEHFIPQALVADNTVLVRLSASPEEAALRDAMVTPEIWELAQDVATLPILVVAGEKYQIHGFTPNVKLVVEQQLKAPLTFFEKIRIPLRCNLPSTYLPVSKKEVFEQVLQAIRNNKTHYFTLEDFTKKPISGHLYTLGGMHSILAEGSAREQSLSPQLLGYRVETIWESTELIAGIINYIISQGLPYTFYFLGEGGGNAPYKVKEYFCRLYSQGQHQFIGASSPRLLTASTDVIIGDIKNKAPQVLFIDGDSSRTQEFLAQFIQSFTLPPVVVSATGAFSRVLVKPEVKSSVSILSILREKLQ
jgi:hypothetical protein